MSRRPVVVIPTLNEETRIGGLLDQLAGLPEHQMLELLVADGGSTDATRELVAAASRRDTRIRLVDNPERIQAAGVNRAVSVADRRADTVIRIDAHALYPDDYVPRILAAFDETGADMVAVRLHTRGEDCLQRGIAAASNSWGGSGGSAHRVGGRSGFVDHGHHAGIDRQMFEAVGGYDASFGANEDAELDVRIRQAGGRIWLAGDIEAAYFPRRTLRALFVQYYRYGCGRARTFLKHGERPLLRQMAPPLLVIAVTASLLFAALAPLLLLVPLAYALMVMTLAAVLVARIRSPCALAAGPAMATMHVAWGAGFLAILLANGPRRIAQSTSFVVNRS